ncbi:hypothetical protein [Marinobacter zhejiangensis]|uniref:hypothetical protein n=1 Tax=Marinobacter zhejiangensis TaxID=488535 RepID=UPI000B895369|nr:hypothetical protein [Marinobacter zhejiangensis]
MKATLRLGQRGGIGRQAVIGCKCGQGDEQGLAVVAPEPMTAAAWLPLGGYCGKTGLVVGCQQVVPLGLMVFGAV